jgi:hypothetical protein
MQECRKHGSPWRTHVYRASPLDDLPGEKGRIDSKFSGHFPEFPSSIIARILEEEVQCLQSMCFSIFLPDPNMSFTVCKQVSLSPLCSTTYKLSDLEQVI